jgi:hypothetical protein
MPNVEKLCLFYYSYDHFETFIIWAATCGLTRNYMNFTLLFIYMIAFV